MSNSTQILSGFSNIMLLPMRATRSSVWAWWRVCS